jgi:TetR/AcrR family transcriptional regulator, tetracycline repressor protein
MMRSPRQRVADAREGGRGRPPAARPGITRRRLVAAALAVLDEHGMDGLSMRRLADRVGVRAASLYNHLENKDELLAWVADAICTRIRLPDPDGHWREQLEQVCREFRRVLLETRDAARVLAAAPPSGPNRLLLIERVLEILRRAGLDNATVAGASTALNGYVVGFVLDETQAMQGSEGDLSAAREQVAQAFRSLPREQFPNLTELADDLVDTFPDRGFEIGLKLFLDGLERRAGK